MGNDDQKSNSLSCWTPAEATKRINRCATLDELVLHYTQHARDQMDERNLIIGDVKHVLKFGFVYEPAAVSTRAGWYKYRIECTTPNSLGRAVRLVVIPSPQQCSIKIVTVMWADEPLVGS